MPAKSKSELWRERAQEARAIAEAMHDPDAKHSMLDVANGYDAMADRAEAAEKLAKPIARGKRGTFESSR